MGNRRTVIAGILLLALTFTNPAAAGALSSAGSTDRLLSSVAVLEEPSALEKIFRNSTGFWHLSPTSPLFPNMRQLRSIIHAVQQSLARQQQPQDLDKGLDLITAIEELLTPEA